HGAAVAGVAGGGAAFHCSWPPGWVHHLFVLFARHNSVDGARRTGSGGTLCRLVGCGLPCRAISRASDYQRRNGMSGVQHREVSADDDGMRVDRWFAKHFPQVGFARLQKLIRNGEVKVDKAKVQTSTRLAEGQTIRI